MTTRETTVDKRVSKLSQWLVSRSSRRSLLARMGGLFFGGYAMHWAETAEARPVQVGCSNPGGVWQSTADGDCLNTRLNIKVDPELIDCRTNNSSWSYSSARTQCGTLGAGWDIPSRSVMEGLIDDGVKDQIDLCGFQPGVPGAEPQAWTLETQKVRGKKQARTYFYTKNPDGTYRYDLHPLNSFIHGSICVHAGP